MQLEVLGIGNAFSAIHYNTSFLIRAGRTILIDGPPSLFRLLKERSISPQEIDGVLVTHVHGDHVAGLETLLLWNRFVARRKTVIYTSQKVFEELEKGFFTNFSMNFTNGFEDIIQESFDCYVDFFELALDRTNRIDDSLSIEIRHNWHPTPTLGLKLISPSGAIGISGDTCYRPELLERIHAQGKLSRNAYQKLTGDWLWSSDLIYHEADQGDGGPHTLESDLLALPEEIQRRIRLIHLPDSFIPGRLPLAKEGERVSFEQGRPVFSR